MAARITRTLSRFAAHLFPLAEYMLAPDFSISDIERIGPIVESLLKSGKLNADEHAAVDLCGRAAFDLANIRHSEVAREFYSRAEIMDKTTASISEWLEDNPDADPGTITGIAGRMHVATIRRDGKLQLAPLLEL